MRKGIQRPKWHQTPWSIVLYLVTSTLSSTGGAQTNAETPTMAWQWRYNDQGQLAQWESPGNRITRLTYSPATAETGQPLTTTWETGASRGALNLDQKGRLKSAKGPGGDLVFRYDKHDRPIEIRSEGAPPIRYTYDVQDRPTQMRIGANTIIGYRYDFLGRLAAVATPVGEISYRYWRSERTTIRQLPNGVQTYWVYDPEGNLVELTHADADKYILAQYHYTYRPDGLLASIAEKNQRHGERTCQYTYDLMQRLVGVDCGTASPSHRYAYDTMGNLVHSQGGDSTDLHLVNTVAGALASDSRGPIQVDERGHIRQLPKATGTLAFAFNDLGGLADAGGGAIRYRYNALGLLTDCNAQGQRARYLPDPFATTWRPLWRRNADGTQDVFVWDGAVPLVELRGRKALYRLEDHRGSVRMEVDGRGQVVSWRDYTPYGEPVQDETGDGLKPGFAGLFWDPVARIYLTRYRAYDPVTARFLQPDPHLRVPGASKHSHSLYAYCGGDPVNFVDRDGAEAVSVWEKGAGLLQRGSDFWSALWQGSGPPTIEGNERDHVIEQIINHAIERANGDIAKADNQIRIWRYSKEHPKHQEYSEIYRNETQPTFNEWQAAENYMYARKYVETGRGHTMFHGKLDKSPGREAARSVGNQIEAWRFVHYWGERFNLPPNTFLQIPKLMSGKIEKDISPWNGEKEGWIPQTNKTIEWQYRGLEDGLYNYNLMPKRPTNYKSHERQRLTPHSRGYRPDISSKARNLTEHIMSQVNEIHEIQQDFDLTGGDGRVAGPGGYASPQAYGALAAWEARQPSSSSPVGGVYLGNAGQNLEGLGQLKGVAIDEETGKLVLIGADAGKIALPPLRLDDIVTVFCAVYDHGQAPTVTIDPDQDDPDGPIMHVKHGPGTEGTYVGWILFECDRVMKTYQLGVDNLTGQPVHSAVPGFTETVEAVFFGDQKKGPADSFWERFWIVPAAVSRFDASVNDLSLFRLPLKVNTQKMRWHQGQLVDDEKGNSSVGARAFQQWFTEHYDYIADEVVLSPPPGSGFAKPIAIFHELRRLAVVAAVAERLCDQGHSMPLWMRDYSVAPFPVTTTTPSLTLERTKEEGNYVRTARIYGGVNLAPADQDVRTYSASQKAVPQALPREEHTFVQQAQREVAALGRTIPELARRPSPPGTTQAIKGRGGRPLAAALLPGAETRALTPNRQFVTDMAVPIGLGQHITLTRVYNSFFDPDGVWGRGWTLDLPRLTYNRVPVQRDGKRAQYTAVPHLTSPLGTIDIRFDQIKRVEAFQAELAVAVEHPEIAGIATAQCDLLGTRTNQVLFRDGTRWHFNDHSHLVLLQSQGSAIRYVWDEAGRLRQLVGYLGTDAVADIRLEHDKQGRIVRARAHQADFLRREAPASIESLEYSYSAGGRLGEVHNGFERESADRSPVWSYTYQAHLLTHITGRQGFRAEFGYNDRGQLLWEQQGAQKKTYEMRSVPQGTLVSVAQEEGIEPQKRTFDTRMRPLKTVWADGSTAQWQYGPGKAVKHQLSRRGKPMRTQTTSSDGRTQTTTYADGPTYQTRFDPWGNPISWSVDGNETAQITWHPNGRLAGLRTEATEVRPARTRKVGITAF